MCDKLRTPRKPPSIFGARRGEIQDDLDPVSISAPTSWSARPKTACQRLRSSPTSRSRKRVISTSSCSRSGSAGPILTRGMALRLRGVWTVA